MNVAGVELQDATPVPGGDICRAWAATLGDGTRVFAKTLVSAPPGFFAAEARGLAAIAAVAGAPPVPDVVAVADDGLVLAWVAPAPASPSAAAASRLGRALAALHASSPSSFGADEPGYVGSLALDNTPAGDWPGFYAERRLLPYVEALNGADRDAVLRVIDRLPELAGPREPPALVHGDLWSGNVLWAADGDAWLVDAASVHGGHRETDLAMLALFGCPHLDVLVRAYDDAFPLAPGWQARVPLHQLHPLLVHATLFGGGYGRRAGDLARGLSV